MRFYHRTSQRAAGAILAHGFRDGQGTYLTRQLHRGVWLSDRPLNVTEGPAGEALLLVEIPVRLVRPYERVEEGKPYREFLVPAELVNRHGRVRPGECDAPAATSP